MLEITLAEKTDLDSLKEVAINMSCVHPQTSPYYPNAVYHPLTDLSIVTLKNKDGTLRYGDICKKEKDFDIWLNQKIREIENCRNAKDVFEIFCKQYRIPLLIDSAIYLSEDDYSRILAEAWVMTEYSNMSAQDIVSMFSVSSPSALMTSQEYEYFQQLGNELTIYRGVTNQNSVDAPSWSLSYETANWFAHRFGHGAQVYMAHIKKEHVYAYFSSRDESEVIVDSDYLYDISKVRSVEG